MRGLPPVTETAYLYSHSLWWQVTTNTTYATVSNTTATVTGIQKRLLPVSMPSAYIEKTVSIDIFGNETERTVGVNRSTATVTNTVHTVDSTTNIVQVTVNDLLRSSRSKTGATVEYDYDALGRRIYTINPRTGTNTTHYATAWSSTVGPGMVDWIENAATDRTSYQYAMTGSGRKTVETNAETNLVRYAYNDRGQLTHTWGDVPYPVKYAYDGYGNMTNLWTYRSGTSWDSSTFPTNVAGDSTIWTYQESTGLLTGKRDAAAETVTYTYGTAGRLATRTWAREDGTNDLVTTYTYDGDTGELTDVDYSDASTPDIDYTWTRAGRPATVSDGVGTRTFTYNADLQPTSEAIVAGGSGLYSATVQHAYEGLGDTSPGRAAGVSLASTYYDVDYGYDAVGRLNEIVSISTVTEGTNVFQYAYTADSDLLASLTETNSEFTISRAYEDDRDLLTQIKAEIPDGGGGTNVVSQYDYVYEAYIYDSIGLRSSVVNDGTAFGTNAEHNIWGYNDRAELTSSYRYVGSDPSTTTNEVTAERRSYVYDPIGNRRYAYVGTSASPNPAYTANDLNQYTSTTDPDEELFDYDEDGNMTEDGTFEYAWNGENRLIQVEPSTASTNDLRLTFTYDYIGRRVQNVVETYDGSSWSTNAVTKFVWDGWLLIAELDGLDSDALTRTHTWGLDLSGTFQGAGGISGLLMVDDDTGDGFCGYYAYDGNGNVGQVLDAEDLSTDAHYEYDPYGLEIVSSGTYADDNPWRFSTKWLDVIDPDDDASLLYFGHRYLSPRLGRWVSRDSIFEVGSGMSLSTQGGSDRQPPRAGSKQPYAKGGLTGSVRAYLYAVNNPTVGFDPTGLMARKLTSSHVNGEPGPPLLAPMHWGKFVPCFTCVACGGVAAVACAGYCAGGCWDERDEGFRDCWVKCIGASTGEEAPAFSATCYTACAACGIASRPWR